MSVEHSPVDPSAEPPEKAEEAALRPGALAEFGGQQRVADQLGLVLAASLLIELGDISALNHLPTVPVRGCSDHIDRVGVA